MLFVFQAEDMIQRIRKTFKESLQSLKWMDEETKAAAIEKVDAITEMIGKYSLLSIYMNVKCKFLNC